uniref:Uncharacterized protein n=1 Tax=Megaviridae environmental sample TaxID=1737588 RepID=A0A5J6VK05_9VIRU|nr:MAG: hypothetical protein [Megaviridae environmental sample]
MVAKLFLCTHKYQSYDPFIATRYLVKNKFIKSSDVVGSVTSDKIWKKRLEILKKYKYLDYIVTKLMGFNYTVFVTRNDCKKNILELLDNNGTVIIYYEKNRCSKTKIFNVLKSCKQPVELYFLSIKANCNEIRTRGNKNTYWNTYWYHHLKISPFVFNCKVKLIQMNSKRSPEELQRKLTKFINNN